MEGIFFTESRQILINLLDNLHIDEEFIWSLNFDMYKRYNSSELRTEKKQKLYGVVYVLFETEKEKLSPEESFVTFVIKVLSTFT